MSMKEMLALTQAIKDIEELKATVERQERVLLLVAKQLAPASAQNPPNPQNSSSSKAA